MTNRTKVNPLRIVVRPANLHGGTVTNGQIRLVFKRKHGFIGTIWQDAGGNWFCRIFAEETVPTSEDRAIFDLMRLWREQQKKRW